jgi:hypothetical protein
MIKRSILSLFIISHLGLNFLHAESIDINKVHHYFEILSLEDTDFEPMGTVCERVALYEIEPLYPKTQFDIINSIEYAERNMTIGELDLVIFNKDSKKAEAIGEVKCWKSIKGSLVKAREQRKRFQTHLDRNLVITDSSDKHYSKDQFSDIHKYFSIAQIGGVEEGFDYEMSLNFRELMELRSELLDCRAQGKCPKK